MFTFDKLTSALVICCRINFLIDVISYVTSNKHNISLKRLLISAIARPPYCNIIVNLPSISENIDFQMNQFNLSRINALPSALVLRCRNISSIIFYYF